MLGVLLVNLGTPDAPRAPEVRRYLAEFLSDGRVLDIGWVPRMLLLYGAILPFRPKKSAAAYRLVWSAERGSPLLFHSQDLAEALQRHFGDVASVRLAMRYGRPALGAALDGFAQDGIDRIVVVPLYPQYASSSTGSTLQRVYDKAGAANVPPKLIPIRDFYDHPGFIDAQVAVSQPDLDAFEPDHVLMSFHGLPERHVVATDFSGGQHCMQSAGCCDILGTDNRACYRAQCMSTARALAVSLDLPDEAWSVSFQSRLGNTPWIRPWTDEVLVELAQSGVRRLAVLCPSFVADCLETLEEIGIRAKADFLAAGGEALLALPCVNATPAWVRGLAQIIQDAVPDDLSAQGRAT